MATQDDPQIEQNQIPVVGIGASAGGLEALRGLFSALAQDTGLAFVVIQHLKDDQESHLRDLLARCTSMSVKLIENRMSLDANSVYVLPPGHDVTLSGAFLNLNPKGASVIHRHGIDFFFSTLSQNRKSKAIGVLLSGTGSDGTLGLKAIKTEGGITIVQDPDTALFDGMPRSAIASGIVDLILNVEGIAQELERLGKHPYTQAALQPHLKTELSDSEEAKGRSSDDSTVINQILDILLTHTRIDFSQYKLSTIRRRIERQMMIRKIETVDRYAEYLKKDSEEVKALYEDIFIHVTDFFRDPEAFDSLKRNVFPALIKDRDPSIPIRIWVPGCATGEEVYSLAISLIEFLELKKADIPISLFAGDISEPALQKARRGIYADYQMRSVSQERLERFFEKIKDGYKINKQIRDLCIFSRHDITSNPPIPKVDLISCRNVLIYFSTDLQRRVFPVFHYALNPNGFLWLGRAEAPESASKLFTAVDKSHKIFTKLQSPLSTQPRFTSVSYSHPAPEVLFRAQRLVPQAMETVRSADQVILHRYSPPSVVIDIHSNILQFRGRTVPFLEPAPGLASYNLLKMANPDIEAALRLCVEAAKKQQTQARREDVPFEYESKTRKVNIDVSPLNPSAPAKDRQYLVVFEDASNQHPVKGKLKTSTDLNKSKQKLDPNQLETLAQYNTQLQQELETTREYQQSLIEEYEAAQEELTSANEELRSTNEELQSTNEELHSTNDELGSAKEELQAANEELLSTNDELQKRNQDLESVLRDLEQSEQRFRMMIETVRDYAIYMLDPQGNVKTWNEGAKRFKGYEASDIIGKHFSAFFPPEDKDWKPKMELEVAARNGRFEDEAWRVRKDGSRFWANVVITAVRDSHQRLIGFSKVTRDLTERKRAEDEVRASREQFEHLARTFDTALSSSPDFYYIFDPNQRFTYANQSLLRLWGKRLEDVVGKNFEELGYPSSLVELHKQQLDEVLTGKTVKGESSYTNFEGNLGYYEYVFVPILGSDRKIRAISGTTRDVTERKQAEQARLDQQRQTLLLEQLKANQAAVENERDNFRHLFKQTPEMVCILKGPDHVFEFVNDAHIRALGFDATGKSVRQAQPESVEVHGILDEVYRTGKTALLHEIPVTLTGRLRYFNLTYAARRDNEGRIDGIMILGVEITHSKLVEEALKTSERGFRTLAEAIPQMVWTTNPEGALTYSNKRWLEYTGFALEESQKYRMHQELHPEDRKKVLNEWDHAKDSGDPFLLEYRLRRMDGTYRWFLGQAVPLKDDTGKITQWFGTVTDIDATKRAQIAQKFLDQASLILASASDYKATLQAVADLVIAQLADWCGVDILNDQGVLEPVAVAHQDPEMVEFAREFRRRYPVDMDAPSGSAKVIKTGEPELYAVIPDELLTQSARDQTHLEMMQKLNLRSLMVVPLTVKGKILGTLSFVLSSNERRYGNEDLSTAMELARRAALAIENSRILTDLKEAVKSRDEFLSIASHELKTPLTPIRLQLQSLGRLIRANPEAIPLDRVKKVVETSDKQINRLTSLVEDLLDVTRINSGKLTLCMESTDLCEVIREVCERYSAQAASSGVTFDCHLPEKLIATFDRLRIEQVVINLITNALKYAPGKPLTIQLQSDDSKLKVSVRDHGIGIAAADLQRIFDRFERVHSSQNIGGLGLGLYISRQIIEAHGGSLVAESEMGQGTTFTFELPVRENTQSDRT